MEIKDELEFVHQWAVISGKVESCEIMQYRVSM